MPRPGEVVFDLDAHLGHLLEHRGDLVADLVLGSRRGEDLPD
jgi:hypothetical protein